MSESPELAECSVYDTLGCFMGEGAWSFLPLFASVWVGLIAISEASVPIALYMSSYKSTLENVSRNDAYKNAWNVMIWGGLTIYGPLAILWPWSYAPNVSQTYVKAHSFLTGLGSILHFTVAFLFWFAHKRYLYESDLSYNNVKYEYWGYTATIYGLFWVTRWALRFEFQQFYSETVITKGAVPFLV